MKSSTFMEGRVEKLAEDISQGVSNLDFIYPSTLLSIPPPLFLFFIYLSLYLYLFISTFSIFFFSTLFLSLSILSLYYLALFSFSVSFFALFLYPSLSLYFSLISLCVSLSRCWRGPHRTSISLTLLTILSVPYFDISLFLSLLGSVVKYPPLQPEVPVPLVQRSASKGWTHGTCIKW